MAAPPRPGRPVRGSRSGRPINAALDLLGRRWALRVLWELRDGVGVGFGELRARCDGMSTSVLRDRLVERTGDDSYALTPLGVDLGTALAPLSRWAERWGEQLPP